MPKPPSDKTKPRNQSNSSKKYDLFRGIGNAISRIRDEDETKTYTPGKFNLYVLEHKPVSKIKLVSGYPKTIEIEKFKSVVNNFRDADDFPDQKKSPFQHYPNTYLVGYDIEYQEYKDELHENYPAKLLSHQFYFNFAGHRFGVVIITEVTFRSIDLVRMLNMIVPLNENKWIPPGCKFPEPELSLVRIYAHFSAIESGWMQPSMQKTSEFTDFFGFIRSEFKPLTPEREKEWCNTSLLRVVKPVDPKTNKSTKKDEWKVYLMYCDSKNLAGGGTLEALGTKIGIEKIKHEHIDDMEMYRKTNLDKFCSYGMMDSVITAEAHLWYNNTGRYQLGLTVEKERAAGLSAELFKNIFKGIYGEHWKRYLGYDKRNKMTIAHRAFVQFYHGGRNEVLTVGPKERAVYYDLRSAYPTSLIMLPDYDFSNSKTFHGEDAERAVRRMEADIENGPFQVAGIIVSFKFREGVPPIFPVRIDEPSSLPNAKRGYDTDGLIFPRTGYTTITWPELWVARNTLPRDGREITTGVGLLDKITVHSLVTFQNLGTRELSKNVYELLKKRDKNDKPMDSYYKQLMNYFYGKTAQAVAEAATSFKSHDLKKTMEISAVTSYPLAAFMTGFCRAAVGELLQKFNCYGITTDGFISPLEDGNITKFPNDPNADPTVKYTSDQLQLGANSFCGRVHDRVNSLNPFIGIESEGDRSLFIKTRGYLIVAENILQKLAGVGAQTKRVSSKKPDPLLLEAVAAHEKEHIAAIDAFLKITQRGKCDKVSWRSLPNQRKYWRAELDALYDSDEVLTRAKQVLTSSSVNVINANGERVNYKEAEKLHGRMMANRQLKHTRDTLPLQVTMKDSKVNISFDMKRIPIDPVEKLFDWQGEPYKYVSFETDPLNSLADFHLLRALAGREISHKLYLDRISNKASEDPKIGLAYKRLNQQRVASFAPVTAEDVPEISQFLPEVAERIKRKEDIRLATNDALILMTAYVAFVEWITNRHEQAQKRGEIVGELDDSYRAFEEFLKTEINRKKERSSNSAPYRPGPDKDDYTRPLKYTTFGKDYEQQVEDYLRKNAEFRKQINAACKVFSKPKKKKDIRLDISFEKEELIRFIAQHGGGNRKSVGAKLGFVDEEPVCMELVDYQHMLREFKKVTRLSIDPTPREMEIFWETVEGIDPKQLQDKHYLALITRRKKQLDDEYELERKSEIPQSMKSLKELEDNADGIVADYSDPDVQRYLYRNGIAGLDRVIEYIDAGTSFVEAVDSIRNGISVEDIKAAKSAMRNGPGVRVKQGRRF